MINNVLYVIILSAALDLVGPSTPKGVVLLADVLPSFLTKLCAPYFIHVVPYSVRIITFAALSTAGMLVICFTQSFSDGDSIATKMLGVVLASLSSGAGELSFLGLTHFYGTQSLAAWGSGTGAAGLVGAGAYALATTSMGFSVRATILASAFLPLVMVASFSLLLPAATPMQPAHQKGLRLPSEASRDSEADGDIEDDLIGTTDEEEGLLGSSSRSARRTFQKPIERNSNSTFDMFRSNLARARGLFLPLSVSPSPANLWIARTFAETVLQYASITVGICCRIHH